MNASDKVKALFSKPEFPRSSRYDPEWMLDNYMGPNAVWLTEWLCEALNVQPGMRILDLGCGRALSSIFLAKEFGARVWAADLWISPDHNWKRVVGAGVENLVCPIRAEAHALPFAQGFFDGVISIDAYQYFGTDELYLNYLTGFVRPGGFIGVVVAGLTQPIGDTVPQHLLEPQSNGKCFWADECRCFHTAGWWQDHWSRCDKVTKVQTSTQSDGWRHWRDCELALQLTGKNVLPSELEALEKDHGRYLGLVRAVAECSGKPGMNYYDPSLGVQSGVDS